jgi:hypothetical protein
LSTATAGQLTYSSRTPASRPVDLRQLQVWPGISLSFSGLGTMRFMFGLAGRRLVEGLVALFALLGFALVPLGRKTALEHTRDIFSTPAALNAFRELGGAAGRLREKLTGAVLTPAPPTPDVPPPSEPGAPQAKVPDLRPRRGPSK